jgi:hypothetical protein
LGAGREDGFQVAEQLPNHRQFTRFLILGGQERFTHRTQIGGLVRPKRHDRPDGGDRDVRLSQKRYDG